VKGAILSTSYTKLWQTSSGTMSMWEEQKAKESMKVLSREPEERMRMTTSSALEEKTNSVA
jgi:hypothetical protein